jgi:hypothetical protein
MKSIKILFFSILILGLSGCKPKTFVKTHETVWAKVELSENVTYDEAWEKTIDLLTQYFDLEMLERDNGYLRTGWLYTWTGKASEVYRVRVTAKFDKKARTVAFKPEAAYKDVIGYDTRLLKTIKSDIMGTLGRVTR